MLPSHASVTIIRHQASGVNPIDQKEGTSWDGHTERVAPGHHCLHDIVIGFVSHHQLPPSCPTAGMAAPGGGEG